jgi:diguanylate cyclase (GGDEF)-like protein
MPDAVTRIARLARELSQKLPLEAQLQHTVDCAAAILSAPRASVRLFDSARTRLIATCRAGEPTQLGAATAEFRVGEGLLGWIAEHNAPLRSGDPMRDPRYVDKVEVTQLGSFLGAPLTSGDVCFGVISAVSPERDAFSAEHEELLMLLAGLCAPHLEMARLARLAEIDPLTGVFNRRGLDVLLPARDERLTALAICDLDRFKRINDAHGHAAGDEVLRRVAHLLGSVLRAGDGVLRWGGEEFLLVLPGVELGRAQRIVERARAWVEHEPIELSSGRVLSVTISVGVAERRPAEPRDAAIARADEALYLAKDRGRNRVELAA